MGVRAGKKMKLLVNILYDGEYQGYVVDVPELPGCMSQGKTVEAALKNARKAIRLYLKETGGAASIRPPEMMIGQIEVTL